MTITVEDIGKGRYVCPKCGTRSDTVGDKKRHMKGCKA